MPSKIYSNIKTIIYPVWMTYLKHRVKRAAKKSDIRIVIGASNIYEKNWLRTEMDFLNLLDPDDWAALFKKNSIKAILAEHVWEHLDENEGIKAAKNCFDYLKPGGYLRIAIPDGYHYDPEYINLVKPGGSGYGADDHKILYNYQIMREMLEDIGFKVNLLEWFDEKGKFNSNPWNPDDGKIRRSVKFDSRNEKGELKYTSLIVDAIK